MRFPDLQRASLWLRRKSIEWRLRAARAVRAKVFDERLDSLTESERVQILARALEITRNPLGAHPTTVPAPGFGTDALCDVMLSWVVIAYRYDERHGRIRLLSLQVLGPSEPLPLIADFTR